MEKGFYPGGEDANPYFACGFYERDRAKVIEGNVIGLLGNGSEEAPFPGRRALTVGPKVSEVLIELVLKVVGESEYHIVGQTRGTCSRAG